MLITQKGMLMMDQSIRGRLALLGLLIGLTLTLTPTAPAQAATGYDCTPSPESGCAWTEMFAGLGVWSAKALTNSWYTGTITIDHKVYRNGALFFSNGTGTCYGTTYCTRPDVGGTCGSGLYTSVVNGWRNGQQYTATAGASDLN